MLRPLLGRLAGPKRGSDGSRPCAGGGCEDRIQPEVSNMAAPNQPGTYWFRAVDLGPGTRTWSGRSGPPAYAEPGPQAALARVALGLTAATRWIGWWELSLLGELAKGLLLLCPRVERTV
jgi:hypothetical protein